MSDPRNENSLRVSSVLCATRANWFLVKTSRNQYEEETRYYQILAFELGYFMFAIIAHAHYESVFIKEIPQKLFLANDTVRHLKTYLGQIGNSSGNSTG